MEEEAYQLLSHAKLKCDQLEVVAPTTEGDQKTMKQESHSLSTCTVVTHNALHCTPLPAFGLLEVDRALLRRGGPKFHCDIDGISSVYTTSVYRRSLGESEPAATGPLGCC